MPVISTSAGAYVGGVDPEKEPITGGERIAVEIRHLREFAESIVETVRDPLVLLDSGLKVLTANHSFYETFKVTPGQTIGKFLSDLGKGEWDIPRLRVLLKNLFVDDTPLDGYEVKHDFPGIGHRIFLLHARRIFREGADRQSILLAMEEITERKRLEEELHTAHGNLVGIVHERTGKLISANRALIKKIDEHQRAKASLKEAYEEISTLKERLQAENIYLHREVAREYNFGEIIGGSAALSYVFFKIEQVASQDATVLLLGETGTGKGVVARAIHCRSACKERPMITVNCASLSPSLVESELFGHEKGAFSGAHDRQIGRFELADGGTIFLDEIGEMPLELQSKLLRVIQDGEFERLGNPRTHKVKVRIIAATNRNLEEEINNGRFREDLFYRLNVFPITIPPLRQRKEDIPLLVSHFVAKFNKKIGKKIATIPRESLDLLQGYHWPGNVRELESVIERAVIISSGSLLLIVDRFDAISRTEESVEGGEALAELEQHHIRQLLQKTGWRIEGKKGAALLLGLNPSTLRARMRKYGIRRG